MRADVAHLFGARAALVERLLHGARRAVAFGVRRRHVVRVARKTVARHLRVDARAARTRALQRLKHKDARALAWNHSLAVAVKGLASFGRDRAEAREPRVGDARESVGASGEHQVGAARSQYVE